ncbi:hypothetical protein [Planomicrobium soli]|uniref:hypothetical protein n=1 Tax=Planomicrobium soli TaxID=1176648 RepID=UPI000D0D0911|nr:hypothetical protein [Planomicrobium soli]
MIFIKASVYTKYRLQEVLQLQEVKNRFPGTVKYWKTFGADRVIDHMLEQLTNSLKTFGLIIDDDGKTSFLQRKILFKKKGIPCSSSRIAGICADEFYLNQGE